MPQEFQTGDMMQFSQVISLEDVNRPVIKNTQNEHLHKSLMIDVLLMLLCERSDHTPESEHTDPESD